MIDTFNTFGVSASGLRKEVTIALSPKALTPNDALDLAAWLVACGEPFAEHSFADVLKVVLRS